MSKMRISALKHALWHTRRDTSDPACLAGLPRSPSRRRSSGRASDAICGRQHRRTTAIPRSAGARSQGAVPRRSLSSGAPAPPSPGLLPSLLVKQTYPYPCCCSSLCRQIVRTRTECAQNQTKPFFGLLWGLTEDLGLTENVKSGDLKMFVLEIPLITSREPKLSVLKTLPIDYRRLLIRLFPGCICIRDRGN